jgi:autotransporter-associated beta strand protein
MDISLHLEFPSVTVGSIEGNGNIFLGPNNLTVGSNNMSTAFSGVIHDGGQYNHPGGSLSKIGSGTLILSGANTYTGATTVTNGTLLVNGSITSAVTVNSGTLGGSGTTGAVTVNSGGTLSPGSSPGILNVVGNLTLTMGSTYLVDLNGTAVGTQYDQTNVTGLVSLGNATFSLGLGFTPPVGSTFIIINNDLTDPVAGTFAGLPEGAVFTAGGEMFMVSYQGGNGNDVVLTAVVPEPSTWALSVLGTGVAFLFFRKIRTRCS